MMKNTINKINELYVTDRKHYLILNKIGDYTTFTKGKNSPMALNDNLIKQHLEGKHTVGVFSGSQFSKFICFDLDMIDKSQTRWMTMNVINSLLELGINESDIHIAHSGNKGIHVLLFSDVAIPLSNFKLLFLLTMQNLQEKLSSTIGTTLHKGNELVLEINDICNIEFRPTNTQGVKLELGINFKNKSTYNKCSFMDKSSFEVIEEIDYFLGIQPMDSDIIEMIINEYSADMFEVIEEGKALVKSNIKESYAHKINRDENETIEFTKSLLINGMTTSGSRNNGVFKLARYFSYMGLELDKAVVELKEWMIRQDRKYYGSTLEYALSECERIAKNVYDKGYTLVGEVENLNIYKDEMIEIMKIKEKNAKLVLFSMLLHSKRFANQNGTFYMTYSQLEEMCEVSRPTAIKIVNDLEVSGKLEIVGRDIKQKGTHIKRPNRYKIKIVVGISESVVEINNASSYINYSNLYFNSVIKLLSNKELKHLPERQYTEIRKYRKLSA